MDSGSTQRGLFAQVAPFAPLALSCVSLFLLLIAGPGYHMGLWQFRTGFTIMKYSAWSGLVAAVFACVLLVTAFRQRMWKTVIISNLALAIGVSSCAIPYFWKHAAASLPKIHDISTDTANPPRFDAILPLRKNAPNPAEYGGTEIARQQAQAYPEIRSLSLDLVPEKAFGLALETAHRMGWKILAADPASGRIEASDTTFWFGFTDDIVIRITGTGNRSQVDIRSVSRVGLSDVGTNARRIRQFTQKMKG